MGGVISPSKIVLNQTKWSLQAFPKVLLYLLLISIFFSSCGEQEVVYFTKPAVSQQILDSSLFTISFESETKSFTKLADEQNGEDILKRQPDGIQNTLKIMAIPRVVRDRQTLVIYKDYSFQLIIEKVPAKHIPDQEHFEGPPLKGMPKEAMKIILNDKTLTFYDEDGNVLHEYPAVNQNPFLEALHWLKTNEEFRKNVDVAGLFVRLSASAHNFLNEHTKAFFIPHYAEVSYEGNLMLVRQNYGKRLRNHESYGLKNIQPMSYSPQPQRRNMLKPKLFSNFSDLLLAYYGKNHSYQHPANQDLRYQWVNCSETQNNPHLRRTASVQKDKLRLTNKQTMLKK